MRRLKLLFLCMLSGASFSCKEKEAPVIPVDPVEEPGKVVAVKDPELAGPWASFLTTGGQKPLNRLHFWTSLLVVR